MVGPPEEEGVSTSEPTQLPRPDAGIHPRPPSARRPERLRWKPSNLVLRLFTASLLAPPVLWICYVGGIWYVGMVIVFSTFAINEFYGFIAAKGGTPNRLLGTLAAAALPLIVYVGDAFLATSFMTAVLLTVMVLQLTHSQIREAMMSVSATFFGVFYVGWLLAHAVSVRFIAKDLSSRYPAMEFDPQLGFFFIIFCLVAAVFSDTGAFFVGRRFGRRKLAPAISPNKTLEGALGGVLAGTALCLVAKFVFDVFIPGHLSAELSYVAAGLFGGVLAVVGVLGDLVESVLKRDADVKDAGRILPGVGGVLDRLDSILLAIPVMYYMLLAYYYLRYGV
jgi:phosphatidate cytidylyltransferase